MVDVICVEIGHVLAHNISIKQQLILHHKSIVVVDVKVNMPITF